MPQPVWTIDQIVAQLDRANRVWPVGTVVPYAFLSSLPASYVGEADQAGFLVLTDTERAFARNAFANVADVANVRFAEASPTDIAGTDGRQITFGASNTMPDYAWGYTSSAYHRGVPRSTIDGADIWLNEDAVTARRWVYGGYNFKALTHEILHALGISHPADYNADGSDITYAKDAIYFQDSAQYTIMSYFDASDTGANFKGSDGLIHSAATLLIDDIAAIQALYGANMSTRAGDSTYGFNSNAGAAYDCTVNAYPIWCVWDAGGIDTLDFSGFSAAQSLNLNPGVFSDVGGMSGNVSIAYGAVVENAIGGAGADRLVGNDVANVLSGGAGADTLSGGAGADSFRDTLADHYGDTITDLSIGDRVVYTDIGYGGFVYQRLGATLAAGAGAVTLSGNPVGHLLTGSDGAGGTALTLGAHVTGLADFNGDGHSDLLWRNTSSGAFTTWQLRGNVTADAPQRNAYVDGSVDGGWQVQGTFDFNGDGGSDLVWRNSQSGFFTVWDANGAGGFMVNAYANGGVGTDWSVAGFGDFNGDGRDDMLWRNAGGQITEWQSTGSGFNANVYVDGSVGNDWKIVGVGDFNGDGRSDLLWRSTGGQFTEWQSNGAGFNANAYVDGSVGTAWHVAAVGDFNGDGKDDILWRNDNGTFTEWQSTGAGFNANVYVNGSVGNDWKIQGVYDFNDDGRADILWRSDTGVVSIWQSTGPGFTPNTLLDGSVGTDWQLMSHHYDFV